MELEEFKSPELTPEEKAFEAGYHAGFNTLAHHGYDAFIEAMAKYFKPPSENGIYEGSLP